MKYIVETITIHRQVHVVEAENEELGLDIDCMADSNWQDHLGDLNVNISEYSEEAIRPFKEKEYYWEGSSFIENGVIKYRHSDGSIS